MSIKSGFFDSVNGDRKYSADDLSNVWVKFISNGVYAEPTTSLLVTANGGMTVKVSPGWAFINSKWLKNDDDYILTLDDSDVEYNRLDRIVLRLDPSDSARAISIEVKKGTAASPTPIVPLTRVENGIWELSIAQVWVFANTTEISQSAIVDERGNIDVCGWVTKINGTITEQYVVQTITQFIMQSISALHPEYTISTFGETVETESDKTMTCTVDLSIYNPDKSDGVLITADGVLVSPLAYGVSVDGNTAKIQFFELAGLEIGQTVYATVYHKPENSSGVIAGEAVAMSDGVISETVSGTANTIIDLLDYELITTDAINSSVPASGKYIELKNFQEWFPVNSNQAIQVIFKYNGDEKVVVGMKINGVHSGFTSSDDGYFVVSELSNYQGVATTVRPLIEVDGIADLSKLTQFYMIITEV